MARLFRTDDGTGAWAAGASMVAVVLAAAWLVGVPSSGRAGSTPTPSPTCESSDCDGQADEAPQFGIDMSSDPAPGSAVLGTDTITYTATGQNTGETPLDPVTLTNDLSRVISWATLDETSIEASIDGAPSDPPVLEGTMLRWAGALDAGQSVTIRFQVTVWTGLAPGTALISTLHGEATAPGGDLLEPADVQIEHGIPGFILSKEAEPDVPFVQPGAPIRFIISAANSGAIPFDRVDFVDDLSDVLPYADIDESKITATLNQQPVTPPQLDGSTISWSGRLEADSDLVISVEATVKADVALGAVVVNRLSGRAVTGSLELGPESDHTEHHVVASRFHIDKTSVPEPGAPIAAGESITYTLTGSAEVDAEHVVRLTDDLADVLTHASLDTASLSATIDGRPAASPILEGTTLTWSGVLPASEVVTVTYRVTVDDDAAGETLVNTLTAVAGGMVMNEHPLPVVVSHDISAATGGPASPEPTPSEKPLPDTGGSSGLPYLLVPLVALGCVALAYARRRRLGAL